MSSDSALRWIADEQRIHEETDYGANSRSVQDSLADQKQRVKLVQDYKKDVDKLKKARDGEKVGDKYKTLDTVAKSRLECLEGVSKIAGLEELVNKLSTEFSIRASSLVEPGAAEEGEVCDGAGAAAQNCILAVKANWDWISKLVHCTNVHLQNASEFHQFFHTAKEYESWMTADLQKAQDKVQQKEEGKGDQKEASQILLELKEVLSTFLHWQGKIDSLFDSSKKVIPVNLRTQPLDMYRPVTALCNYKTKEINVREGEEMTLTDNSNAESWRVRTLSFTESDVPSVICLIPGPDAGAVHLANKLRLQLLGTWTITLKRIGKTLIWFMLLTVKNFDDKETKKLKAIPAVDKNELGRMLAFIETALGETWSGYDGYKELECRNTNLRKILQVQGPKADHDPKMAGDLKQRLEFVEELLKKYKNLWEYWETYKCLVETSANPEYLLIVDAWQQLKFLELQQLKQQWPAGLKFSSEDNVTFNEWLSRHGGCIHERGDQLDGETTTTVRHDLSRHTNKVLPQESTSAKVDESSSTVWSLETANVAPSTETQFKSKTESKSSPEALSTTTTKDEKVEWHSKMLEEERDRQAAHKTSTEESASMWSIASNNPDFVPPPQSASRLYSSGTTGGTAHQDSNVHQVTETMESVTTETLESSSYSNGFEANSTATLDRQYETAETEQVSHMEQEERKTFVITGVFDSVNNEDVSMQKAVMLGIINSETGMYNDLKTGDSVPIPAAMNAGLIKVEFTSTKRTEEKRRDIGLITIKTHKESRPYTVKAVIDAKTDKHLSIDEAIAQRILDQGNGVYYNTLTDTEMSLGDALDTGLLVVEFDDSVDVGEPEIVTKTYAIHAVVDQKARKKITFTEAVRKNLLDRETGAYLHNVDNEYIYVGDAIRRGFIKATVVQDPSSLDIDPENKMVVEKMDNIRKKMLGPMKALTAMKKAAEASELTPQLTPAAINATHVLLPFGADSRLEGVTLQFVEDSDNIPQSQLERVLMEMEGMKTTHLGCLHIFPAAPNTNTSVQTDSVQIGEATVLSDLAVSSVSNQNDWLSTSQTETHTRSVTDLNEHTSTNRSSSTVTPDLFVSSEGGFVYQRPKVVSVQMQTDPLVELVPLNSIDTQKDSDNESFASVNDDEEQDKDIDDAVMKKLVEVYDKDMTTEVSREKRDITTFEHTNAEPTIHTKVAEEWQVDITKSETKPSVADKNVATQPEQEQISCQTEVINVEDKSNQSKETSGKENQTEEIKTENKITNVSTDQELAGTQTEAIETSLKETQQPDSAQGFCQTETIPTADEHSQTGTRVTTGMGTDFEFNKDVFSQTEASVTKSSESQTDSPVTGDNDSQTEPDVKEAEIHGNRKPPDGAAGVETECQTDLTETMMLQLIHKSNLISKYGDKFTGARLQESSQTEAAGKYEETVASRESLSVEEDKSRVGFQESRRMQFSDIFYQGGQSGVSRSSVITVKTSDTESSRKTSDLSPVGPMHFPDFLDSPGEPGELHSQEDVEDVQAADNADGALPDLVSPEERRSSGTFDSKELKTHDFVPKASSSGFNAETDSNRNTMSSAPLPFTTKEHFDSGSKPSSKTVILAKEASHGVFISGEVESESVEWSISPDPGEQETSSKSFLDADVFASLDIDPMRLIPSKPFKPPYLIKYNREDEKIGDYCTFFCRLCLPPYVVFLLMLALACLLSLSQPDALCCFENHYPSTFGVKMVYPNGRPPF